jgi:hypothetical protein
MLIEHLAQTPLKRTEGKMVLRPDREQSGVILTLPVKYSEGP